WAIFDNPTSLDLEDVTVSFVAGQPLSFISSLYEPVYAERPRVEASVAPVVVPPAYAAEAEPMLAAPAPVAQARSAAQDMALAARRRHGAPDRTAPGSGPRHGVLRRRGGRLRGQRPYRGHRPRRLAPAHVRGGSGRGGHDRGPGRRGTGGVRRDPQRPPRGEL